MRGWNGGPVNLPRLPELFGRTVLAAAFVLGAAWFGAPRLSQSLVPVLRAAVEFAEPRFLIYSMEFTDDSGRSVLCMRANLARPTRVGKTMAFPVGWNGPKGGYQVQVTGLLGYPMLLLIALLAWPVARWREMGLRLLLCVPIAAVLLLLDGPVTMLAETWYAVRQQWEPGSFSPLMALSRFLMGGGGYALALLGAAVVVRQAGRAV
jgi:hypothetical protein